MSIMSQPRWTKEEIFKIFPKMTFEQKVIMVQERCAREGRMDDYYAIQQAVIEDGRKRRCQ
jgi:hypothetical protein